MKKILNIFVSFSLVTVGASSLVACGSHHNPNPPTPAPPKSESQKLFDELNETKTPFLIKDDYFWGNEANYQQDLLNDLEKAAHITSQEDKNLLHDANVKPLTQKDGQTSEVQSVDINIDGIQDPAIVKIKWELTSSQKIPGLFKFYTQTWPQEISKLAHNWLPSGYHNNFIPLWYGGWNPNKIGPEGQKGWWDYDKKNQYKSITWKTKIFNNTFQQDLESSIANIINSVPDSLKKLIKVNPPSSIPKLNINKVYNIPLNDIYLAIPTPNKKKNPIKYNLGYYSSYDSAKPLPKMQNWQISYDTYYNLMQNELNNPKNVWSIGPMDPNSSKASDEYNSDQILGQLAASKYEWSTEHLTFSGELKSGVAVPIEVYYDKVDLGFPIYVEAL